MKKTLSKIYIFIILSILTIENTYAATFNMTVDTAVMIYILCGLFVLIGIVLLVMGKISNKKIRSYENDKDEDDHEIVGLIDQEKIDRSFDPDSIFKDIPTFSNKKFFELTIEELKKDITKKEKNIENINITNQKIVDFKNEDKKYIITTELVINYTEKEENEEIKKNTPKLKKETKYSIISEKDKDSSTPTKQLTKCPSCGGKLKTNSKNRCLHCGSQIEKENNVKKTWKIKEIKKMDK